MKLEEYLSAEEIRTYKEEWKDYKPKYRQNKPETVHSGIPVIGTIYRFRDKNVFRAHVFNRRLRKFDPYHIADECLQHFWHGMHYFMVSEQIYTTAKIILVGEEYNRIVTKEVPIELNWKRPIDWEDHVSIELVLKSCGKIREYEKECCNFTIYSDKTGKTLSRMKAETYAKPRAYINEIQKLRAGDQSAITKLIKKIERHNIVLKKLKEVRNNADNTAESLKNSLALEIIPEQELHQFFNLWAMNK